MMSTSSMHRMLTPSIVANYVRRHALFAMLGAAVLLLLLQVSFAYLGEIEDVKAGYSFVDALTFILWQSPRFLYELLPMAALVGAVVGLGALANNSELTVMRAAGISLFRLVTWVVQSAMILIVLALLLNQFVLPLTNARATYIKTPDEITRVGQVKGYWTRSRHQVVYVDYANESGRLSDVTLWQLDDSARIRTLTSAASGHYLTDKKRWQLTDSTTIYVTEQGETSRQREAKKEVSLPLNPKMIYMLTRPAEDLSLTQLYRYNRDMCALGKVSNTHRLVFWQKVLAPFSVISLVLIACSFVFGSLRQQSMGLRLVVALMVGIGFSYIQDLAGFMSLAYKMSPVWFVLLPIILSALLGIILLKRKR